MMMMTVIWREYSCERIGRNCMSLFVLNIKLANRSVFMLGHDNQEATASATWQAAWLWNTPLVTNVLNKPRSMKY